jgi:hypothetical protein
MKRIILVFLVLVSFISYSQNTPKFVTAIRAENSPSIDGILNESFWLKAENASGFTMFDPGSGNKEPENRNTIVKVAYDNQAIYIGAILYDDNMEKIPMQFSNRDQIGQVDYFQVNINPNNDGQNDLEFIVMSTGAQADSKPSFNGMRGKDMSWSAVWDSSVKINNNNWVVEMKIPYAALRFSNKNNSSWGINFFRKMHGYNEQYSWNFIDKTKGKYTQYAGLLKGLTNIKPPVRLALYPYASAAYLTDDSDNEFEKSVGMDLKYGISESFTLDATLIPDFNQTAFDNVTLNLGPFEQHFQEQRAFFTEGTEIFDKGRLFYSRRIGNTPVGYEDIEDMHDEDEIIDNPDNVNMLNAIKVSGRTKNGLGIGFFNAITEKTYAKIKDLTTDEIQKVITEPFANYNVLVIDQEFNKNSSISLVNTNVMREGSFRDANSSALVVNLVDKNNKYKAASSIKMSSIWENGENTTGYLGFINLEKISGNYQYEVGHWRADNKYDINDLGFMRRNNYANYFGRLKYQIFEPTKHFNSLRITGEASFRYLNQPNKYTGNEFELDAFAMNKKRLAYGINFDLNTGNQYDYYEPRVDGRYIKQKGIFETEAFISTDYRKKFALDLRAGWAKRIESEGRYYKLVIEPRFRFSDKFMVIYKFETSKLSNEKKYVDHLDDESEIYFGNQVFKNLTNSIAGTYSFSTKSTLSLAFRHYWSPVDYSDQYYELNQNGTLSESDYYYNHDINYNIWNLDLSYTWEFAPGSQLVALYRNSIFNEDELSNLDFRNNLENLFNQPITNRISIKLIYYLDYNKLKTWL